MAIQNGAKFGKWTVIEQAGTTNDRRRLYLCRCECGRERKVVERYLLNGKSTSCGCSKVEGAEAGERFGLLTVIGIKRQADANGHERMGRLCKCDCGTIAWFRTDSLLNGTSRHCGCSTPRKSDFIQNHNREERIQIYSKITFCYFAMLHRCYDVKCHAFPNYGGRGITVCEEWRRNKREFIRWALASGFQLGLTIDRIDNNGNYCPENCRWVTKTENSRHTRNTKIDMETARRIRNEYASGVPQVNLCAMFGLSAAQIHRIVRGERWVDNCKIAS